MNESVHQQIIPLIERSERILLCTHRKPDGDAVGSIMALTKALNLLGKEVTAACADEIPDTFHFLPDMNLLHRSVAGGKDFVVTLDCDKTEVDRLKYHLEDNKIHIVITPKSGNFVKENVSCHEGTGNYDLIITVDVADIPQLGKLYEENSELFASVPVVNIDHHISNTQFGKINHIDVAASSTAEMLYALIRDMEQKFGKKLITADVATFLLSGVTTDTGSFQNANTTPKSMEVAADLMEAGANQHDVIKYLFRTKKLSTLKLWGKILTKIEVDPKHQLVWSSITNQDLKHSEAHIDEAGDIIDELLVHAPEAEMVALFKEDGDLISVSFRSTNAQANVMEIAKTFGGGGHVQAAGVKFEGKTLPEVMNQVIAAMQAAQRKRLGLEGIEEAHVGAQNNEITQVLDGYTPGPTSIHPTLEQRAVAPQQPLAPSGEVPVVPAEAPGEVKAQGTKVNGSNDQISNNNEGQSRVQSLESSPQASSSDRPPVVTEKTPQNAPQAHQGDLHHQTKAAIHAEQSQASDQILNTPSQGAAAQRPEKPQVEQRFNEQVPSYLKGQGESKVQGPRAKGSNDQSVSSSNDQGASNGGQSSVQGQESSSQPSKTEQQQVAPPAPQAPVTPAVPPANTQIPHQNIQTPPPSAAPTPADNGVSVSYGNTPAQTPVTPENSSEPIVKTVNPAPAGSTNSQVPSSNTGATAQGTAGMGAGQQSGQQAGGQAQGAAGTQTGQQQAGAQTGQQQQDAQKAVTPPTPPKPPKDPFATGDDGLTDIERALGGL